MRPVSASHQQTEAQEIKQNGTFQGRRRRFAQVTGHLPLLLPEPQPSRIESVQERRTGGIFGSKGLPDAEQVEAPRASGPFPPTSSPKYFFYRNFLALDNLASLTFLLGWQCKDERGILLHSHEISISLRVTWSGLIQKRLNCKARVRQKVELSELYSCHTLLKTAWVLDLWTLI